MMTMNRRNFINSAAAGAAIVGSGPLLAKDYSAVTERDKLIANNRYDYTQHQINALREAQTSVIENNVLPKNYKQSFWDQPRRIYAKRAGTNEQGYITYFKNGQVDLQGYWHLTYLMRDMRANLMAYPDLKLLDLLCAVQAWMIQSGNSQPLIITSGFRTQQNNDRIEGSAKNSQHVLGRAVDFVVPGFDPAMIGRIATHFQAGGVGIYLDQKFNHLDTASVRSWTRYKK